MGFCRNCGTELKQGEVFCVNCGTKIDNSVPETSGNTPNTLNIPNTPNTPPYIPNMNNSNNPGLAKGNTKKLIAIIGISVVALIALIVLVNIIKSVSTPGYEKPIKSLTEGLEKYDFKKMISAYPDYISDDMEDYLDYFDDEEEMFDEMFGSLEDEYGKRIKISYKITDKDKMDRDEIEAIEEDIEYSYDEEVNIKEGYTLEVKLTIKGSEDRDTDKTEIDVIRIGSKWYLANAFGDF